MGWLRSVLGRLTPAPAVLPAPSAPAALPAALPSADSRPAPDRRRVATELAQAGRPAEAAELLAQLLREDPAQLDVAAQHLQLLMQLGRHAQALPLAQRLLGQVQPNADLLVLAAVAAEKCNRFDEALAHVERALALDPVHADAHFNRVAILVSQGRTDAAADAARAGLAIHPEHADLHWAHSFVLLLRGQLREGWAEHEWRIRSRSYTGWTGGHAHPSWCGEDLHGKTLLLYGEQGFGDSIQFVRYLPQLAAARELLLAVPAPLESLLRDAAPNCRIVPAGSPLPPFDVHCPLMSLPHRLGTTLETIPAQVPYLHADGVAVQAWRGRLGDGRFNVGIAWSGRPTHPNDRNRSTSLAALQPLAAVPGCRLVTLQPELRDEDRQALLAWPHAEDLGAGLRSFADTAALIEALDLVISVDTSVAHLAGALGRPVWVLLADPPEWRWLGARTTSPWYPTARLYRQPAPGAWTPVLRQVADDLARLAGVPMPAHAQAATPWLERGNAALAAGDLQEAARCYEQGCAARPADAALRLNLGYVLLEQGQPSEAVDRLRQALALAEGKHEHGGLVADAQYLLAGALRALNRPQETLAALQAALAARPDFAEALRDGCALLQALGRHDEQRALAGRWASALPGAPALLAVAQAAYMLGRHSEALDALATILAHEPDHVMALAGQAPLLLTQGDATGALAACDRVLALAGPDVDTLSNAAAALLHLGRLEEALRRADAAVALQPVHRDALYNRARVLHELLRPGEAASALDVAVQAWPDDADLRWNRALSRLFAGDLPGGWADFEVRWTAPAAGPLPWPADGGRPRWTGTQSLQGRSILVLGEQGLGDMLQFLRYVPLLRARGASVLLNVPATLHPLLRTAMPDCQLVTEGTAVAPPDFQVPLLSLPLAFGTSLANVPAQVPYLASEPRVRRGWGDRLGPRRGPRVGVVWSGSAGYRNDHQRSIALEAFARIAVDGVQFVSLQKELREHDRAFLARWPALSHHGEALHTLADTAALADCMDLVISVDTSVAHLAGALGRPLWLLLPPMPDWRWLCERADSPWYPTARLFRQQREAGWEPVLDAVRDSLRRLAAAG